MMKAILSRSGETPVTRLVLYLASPILYLAVAAAPAAFAAGETYTIAAPLQPGYVSYCARGVIVSNDWMNGVYTPSGGVMTNAAKSCDNSDVTSTSRYRLISSETFFSWQRNRPEYYLGDVIKTPENVDWKATKEHYDRYYAACEERGVTPAFLLNPDDKNHCVYVVSGGTQSFVWYRTDGSAKTNSYTVAATCSGRPRRIFWTDAPYNAPTVSLQGKFVRMFDNGNVTRIDKGTVTNIVGGTEVVQENKVVWGVYIDETAQVMYATGTPQGQFVLVYYDTGDYNNILCVEVIEVSKPEAIANTGTIGEPLKPDGQGYPTEGLEALVHAGVGDADDNRGDYLYQHAGQHSYSPKDGNVYPLRPSVGKRWKAEVYWMETDPMGVVWPFELDQYENDWPAHGHLYVRGADISSYGAKIYIPSDYTAELCGFQEPNGHAVAVDSNNAFYTTGEGWSLLKLTDDDNVWFMPIHSILNTDANYFTREPLYVNVGQEFLIGGGVRARVAEGAREFIAATDDAPGYIYRPTSGTQYNADLYHETTNATADASSQVSTDVVGDSTSTSTPSAIFAVNTGTNDIEVWWSRRERQDDMPSWIDIPTLVQLYRPVWPGETEAPTIVLASQQGGAGESLFQNYGAATFDRANSSLRLAARDYFPDGTGMLSFWTRASAYADAMDGVTNAPTCLIMLGNSAGRALALRIGTEENLELVVDATVVTSVALPKPARPNVWMHVALAIEGASTYALSLNAEVVATGGLPNAGFLADTLDRCIVGRPLDLSFTNVLAAATGVAPPPDTTGFAACGTWDDVKANLEAGRSVILLDDIVQGSSSGIRLAEGAAVTLDLNGHVLYGSAQTGEDFRTIIQTANAKSRFTLQDSAGTGAIDGSGVVRNAPGGAIFAGSGATCILNGGTIRNFASSEDGGAVCADGSLTVDGTAFIACSAAGGGGAIVARAGAACTFRRGVVGRCTAGENGAAASVAGGTFTMYGGLMATNTVKGARSGVQTTGGAVTLAGGTFDLEPTAANVQVNGRGSFTEPLAFEIGGTGFYKIGLGTAVGRQVAEITLRSAILSAKSIEEARYRILTGNDEGVTGYYSFRPGEDLASVYQISKGVDYRRFTDRVQGFDCVARNVSLMTPGAPTYRASVIEADEAPTVYYRNAAADVGYNPNEEHAFVQSGSGGYVAWALRADLNTDGASKPAVLVSYVKDGAAQMKFFHVVVTNAVWPSLAGACTAGLQLPGPKPMTAMDDPWLPEDRWDRDPANGGRPGAVYRDRKGQLWARCAGTIPFYKYYRLQEGFWFPQYGDSQPAVGTAVPWLSVWADPDCVKDPINALPACWTWTASWPSVANVMKIGQTLYTAADGLPGVYNMKSLAVVYPAPCEETHATETVTLTDPTVMQSVAFDTQDTADAFLRGLGLTTDPNGGLTLRKGKYYFTELPPHLSSRLYVDATTGRLCFLGKWDAKNAGVSILYVNVLSAAERKQLRNVVQADVLAQGGAAVAAWEKAVAALGTGRVEPNASDMTADGNEVKTLYTPRDSYALTARGGTGWVVLVENDAPATCGMGVSAGDAINVHLLFVTNRYYTARVVAREDEENLLSQRLTMMYVDSFGGDQDEYEFQWRSASPNADGTIPAVFKANGEVDTQAWALRAGKDDADAPRITIGEQGDTLANMVNKYWICRYRAKNANCPAYATMGADTWSGWTENPALAEGWVQRVLNNVTPFNQLMTDLYENKAETAVSMLKKAGKPYTGDVAFNQDALTDCGLIELYETLFNKAESMSLLLGEGGDGVCEQLLLCAERLGDLYTVLGDEAYSDAKNPTVGFGSTMTFSGATQTQVDFGAASSGLFCFDNQVSSLLDEELALLRGRAADSLPYATKGSRRVTNLGPYYNRLLWNFTKGITAGEVAYAVNYNIAGTETTALSEEQAAALYPQGHGDAYGHYLSALKGWYRLLRNPYFNWVRAQGSMTLADTSVNVDYYEEAKFSEAALKVAKTAADVVDLTARKARANDDTAMTGYRDAMTERAFGYGEWANRGAYGALVNWGVANSLLPEDGSTSQTSRTYNPQGLSRIDRGTVDELAEICTQASAIQCAEDRIDAGYNPLGLNDDAIPFDITPIGANDGTLTHFEQIRARAGTAVANARALLDKAQEYSNRLRMIQESTESYASSISQEEAAYNQELIGYYGRPYSDDVGPGATYEQGYDGPDLLHYMWMDVSKYGLDDVEDTASETVYYFDDVVNWTWKYAISAIWGKLEDDYEGLKSSHTMAFQQSASGLVVKPDTITGTRPMQGSIQDKYGAFLAAYAHYKLCLNEYEIAAKNYQYEADWTMLSANIDLGVMLALEGVQVYLMYSDVKTRWQKKALNSLEYAEKLHDSVSGLVRDSAAQVTGAGMTVVTDPKSIVMAAKSLAENTTTAYTESQKYLLKDKLVGGTLGALAGHAESVIKAGTDYYYGIKALLKTLTERADVVNAKYMALSSAEAAVVNAIEAYNSEVAKAEMVLEKRESARRRQVDQLSQARYNDMFFRQLRNQALARYTASFDLAQKYAWEAAKAYDYETALLSSDAAAGRKFLDAIIAARALGSFDADGKPIVGDVGDTGLAGILAQLDANWLVLKPRLGINNPQPYATWFSLRGECFRILPGAKGDAAWAKELTKHWVEDLASNADFKRYCQPFQSQFGLQEKEPGLIIPFETTIDFAKNFFGQDLAGNDSAYDSTWYATRIYAAGLWFDGYNAKAPGAAASTEIKLAKTPVAYLVPMGLDCMRVPGLEEGRLLGFSVVDQVIAAPYAIGASQINDLSWFPTASDGDLGGADATTKIRRHPSFRAYFDPNGGTPTDDQLDCTRLVGRSVWNTKWMLVIPAGGMNANRDQALSIFINGQDQNRDGKLDLAPVSDIRIGFKTYSNAGN